MMQFILKIWKFFIGQLTLLKYKILYGKRFKFKWSDRVCGSLKIRISGNGSVHFGERVLLREYVIINASNGVVSLGDEVFLNDMVCLNAQSKIEIGEKTIVGQGTKLYDHDHDYRHDIRTDFAVDPITVGKNVWLGADVLVLKGSHIDDGCVVGAGTLVKGEVEKGNLVYDKRNKQVREIV